MKITIVCGLLGGGKTSFIKNHIDSATEKTVVLVNDFGSLGIDAELISSGGLETVELPGGCVCCALKMDLMESVGKIIREMAPAHLVIEPSGLASPSGVLEALGDIDFNRLDVVCILDASEFMDLYKEEIYGNFFLEQVRLADMVLLNKTDLADDVSISGALDLVKEMNPAAHVVKTVGGCVDGGIPELPLKLSPKLSKIKKQAQGHGHALAFKVISMELGDEHSRESIAGLFSQMAEKKFGNIVRAKALVQTHQGPYRFDLAWGNINEVTFNSALSRSRLVVIGPDIVPDIMEEEIRNFLQA
ncbi:MAG TPA: hypothetical protein ENI12_03370 [Nitrospirae bacterium]|nr:hypothetical protein [Nitrospirota bacterium]